MLTVIHITVGIFPVESNFGHLHLTTGELFRAIVEDQGDGFAIFLDFHDVPVLVELVWSVAGELFSCVCLVTAPVCLTVSLRRDDVAAEVCLSGWVAGSQADGEYGENGDAGSMVHCAPPGRLVDWLII